MLRIAYRQGDRRAELSWEVSDDAKSWLAALRRALADHSDSATHDRDRCISLPWASFLSARAHVHEVIEGFSLERGTDYQVEREAEHLLQASRRTEVGYQSAKEAPPLDEDTVHSKLRTAGFTRPLTPEQRRNVARLAAVPAAATFSVPGAGKTTEALATFIVRAVPSERLMVVAPKNAFGSWDEQFAECLSDANDKFVRLRGGWGRIEELLSHDPRFTIISYQQFARVRELIAGHLATHPTHLYLDESHRIKRGTDGAIAAAILDISHLPAGKLIMSGTPMPQATGDLVPQFSYLYPEIGVDESNASELIRPVYVRTTKAELGLPPVTRRLIQLPMAPTQARVYGLMKSQVLRDAETAMSTRSRAAFRSLGRSVARLLQLASNPALLAREIGFAHSEVLGEVLAEGDSPKMKYVVQRTRELARQGRKVLVWSSFVANVELLAQRLSDLGAVLIHGGVDAGDDEDEDTREGRLRLFHRDPDVKVLVANPAAASEGISLHTVCHHGLYLDRTFNAAHYLQSEDRIHRLGLKSDQETVVEIVECLDTVDETVRNRLTYKVSRMAAVLEDASLRIEAVPYDPPPSDDPIEEVVGALNADDVEALLDHLRQ